MQPNQQPLIFDGAGNLLLTGIKSQNGNWSINSQGNSVFQNMSANTINLNGVDLQTTINKLATTASLYGGTWQPLTYQNGWADLSTTDPKLQVRLLNDNAKSLHIVGSMHVGTYTDGTTIATLPATNYYPANNVSIPVWISYSTAPTGFYASGFPGRIAVDSDGTVKCWDIAQTGGVPIACIANGVIPLDAITGSSSPAPVQYTKQYPATFSATYQQDGTNRGLAECYQGYYSSTNGNQWSVIGFNAAQIQSDLTGATINSIQLYLHNKFWYYNAGGTAVVGWSTINTGNGNQSYSSVTPDQTQQSFSYGQSLLFNISGNIGTAFQNGSAKSIALGQGPTTSQTYYGYFEGYNDGSSPPYLEIVYTK